MEKWLSGYGHWLLSQTIWFQFPVLAWQLTTVYDGIRWLLLVTWRQSIHIHKLHKYIFKRIQERKNTDVGPGVVVWGCMFRKLRQGKFQFMTCWSYTARPCLNKTKNINGTYPDRFNLDSKNLLLRRTQAFSAATNMAPDFNKPSFERDALVFQDDRITMHSFISTTDSNK